MPDPTSAPDQANLNVGLPLVRVDPRTSVLVGAVAVGASVSRTIVSLATGLTLPWVSVHLTYPVRVPFVIEPPVVGSVSDQPVAARYGVVNHVAPSFEMLTVATPDVSVAAIDRATVGSAVRAAPALITTDPTGGALSTGGGRSTGLDTNTLVRPGTLSQ